VTLDTDLTFADLMAAANGALESGHLAEAMSALDQAVRRGPKLDHPAFLMPDVLWVDVGHAAFFSQALQAGLQPLLMPQSVSDQTFPGLTAGNARGLSHRGISLWDAAIYDYAIQAETTPRVIAESMGDHLEGLSGAYGRATQLIDRAYEWIAGFRPDLVLYPQGYFLPTAVCRLVAAQLGVPVMAIENSFDATRMLVEPTQPVSVPSASPRAWYRDGAAPVSSEAAKAAVDAFFTDVKARKQDEHSSADEAPSDLPQDGKPLVLFLAQVATDASVQFGLSDAYVDQTAAIIGALDAAKANGTRLLVKPHPKENNGLSPIGSTYANTTVAAVENEPQAYKHLIAKRLMMDKDHAWDTYALIRMADAVVTINSQSGLEAAALGTPVITLGDAFYDGLGFTLQAQDSAALKACLTEVLGLSDEQRATRQDAAQRFFAAYHDQYLKPKTAAALVEAIRQRVSAETSAAAAEPASPAEPVAAQAEPSSAPAPEPARPAGPPPDHMARYDWVIDALRPGEGEAGPARIADIACGPGAGTERLAQALSASILACDGDDQAIRLARTEHHHPRIEYRHQAALTDLTGGHDAIVALACLEREPDLAAALQQLCDRLNPGGRLFVAMLAEAAVPLARNLDLVPGHRHHADADLLAALGAQCGLVLTSVQGQSPFHMEHGRLMGPNPSPDALSIQSLDANPTPQILMLVFERVQLSAFDFPTGRRLLLSPHRWRGGSTLTPIDPFAAPGPEGLAERLRAEIYGPVAHIVVADTIEALPFKAANDLLRGLGMLMPPGGRLEVHAPDIAHHARTLLADAATQTGPSAANPAWSALDHAMAGLYGWQRPDDPAGQHRSGWTGPLLISTLKAAGFASVLRVPAAPWALHVAAWK